MRAEQVMVRHTQIHTIHPYNEYSVNQQLYALNKFFESME